MLGVVCFEDALPSKLWFCTVRDGRSIMYVMKISESKLCLWWHSCTKTRWRICSKNWKIIYHNVGMPVCLKGKGSIKASGLWCNLMCDRGCNYGHQGSRKRNARGTGIPAGVGKAVILVMGGGFQKGRVDSSGLMMCLHSTRGRREDQTTWSLLQWVLAGVAGKVSEGAGVGFDTLSFLFVSSHCTGQCVLQPMFFRKAWTKSCITKLLVSRSKCWSCLPWEVCHTWMKHSSHVLLQGWLFASEHGGSTVLFLRALWSSPHPQLPEICDHECDGRCRSACCVQSPGSSLFHRFLQHKCTR